jgi:hypothetical protein
MSMHQTQRKPGRRTGRASEQHAGYGLFTEIECAVRLRQKQFLKYEAKLVEDFRVEKSVLVMRYRDNLTYQQIVDALKEKGTPRTVPQVRGIIESV